MRSNIQDITEEMVAEIMFQWPGAEERRRHTMVLTLDDGTETEIGTVAYDHEVRDLPHMRGQTMRSTRVDVWTRAHGETNRMSTVAASVWTKP